MLIMIQSCRCSLTKRYNIHTPAWGYINMDTKGFNIHEDECNPMPVWSHDSQAPVTATRPSVMENFTFLLPTVQLA